MILENSDIKHLLPYIKMELIKEMKEERFLTYPEGMAKFLCDGEVSDRTKKRMYRLWTTKGFPRENVEGAKGVYLTELKQFQKKHRL